MRRNAGPVVTSQLLRTGSGKTLEVLSRLGAARRGGSGVHPPGACSGEASARWLFPPFPDPSIAYSASEDPPRQIQAA